MNIYDVIRRETSSHLEHAAVVEDDRRLSYGELFDAVDELARHLRSSGVEANHRVALSCADSIDYIVVSLAKTNAQLYPDGIRSSPYRP